ncbi:Pectin lyase-like superfamily protein [Rhynchospora pubera]|uniref:Pectin lyase-like superfamily protein n=1 Tax=Rhynchospora pubera TaxID=906938 RepID=A0AAV8ANZ2_9POAL|nr:Pectin lyase-like superfamily protein [Rhynchospora pubera]
MEFQRHRGFSITIKLTTWLLLIATVSITPSHAVPRRGPYDEKPRYRNPITEIKYASPSCRAHVSSLTEFGGVGDGTTLNTDAFRSAVEHLSQYSSTGGGMLYVPAGKWLTGPFNLTSCFTLFLDKDATILATQDVNQWPLIDPLPSYGRGRDKPGGRYSSLIGGANITDVVITGDNGTIDGQGASWWQKFHKNQLKYTRGYLIELLYSDRILISNLTLVNSPAWNIHPVYSSNIVVSSKTILAPVHSPNTDGINPDSCSQVRIEDCYVVSGDDCVAIKSGWDQYGISYGMPSQHIVIRRLTCISPPVLSLRLEVRCLVASKTSVPKT